MNIMAKMSEEEITNHFKDGPIEAPVRVTGIKSMRTFTAWGNSTTPFATTISIQRFGDTLFKFGINAMGGKMNHYSPAGEEAIFFDLPEIMFDPPDKLRLIEWAMTFIDSELGTMQYSSSNGLVCMS